MTQWAHSAPCEVIMASLIRLTPGKGAYVMCTGSRVQCAEERARIVQWDKFAYKSVFIVADEIGFDAMDGAKRAKIREENWK